MLKIIAGLIAGFVLATAGVAGAYSTYWKKATPAYNCSGIRASVICYGYGYTVLMSRGRTALYAGTGDNPDPIITCPPYRGMYSCEDLRP